MSDPAGQLMDWLTGCNKFSATKFYTVLDKRCNLGGNGGNPMQIGETFKQPGNHPPLPLLGTGNLCLGAVCSLPSEAQKIYYLTKGRTHILLLYALSAEQGPTYDTHSA